MRYLHHLVLIVAFVLLSGCAHQEFYQIPYSKIDSVWKPYDGWNFEFDIFNFNVSHVDQTTWGFGIAQMNFFYKLALGLYVKAGVPALGEGTNSSYWIPGAGLIIEPVVTQYLKLAGQVGFAGLIYETSEGGIDAVNKKAIHPGIEFALGLFTAFHYRAGLDFYVAKGMDPDVTENPLVFAVRLHLIGFSWKAFSKGQTGWQRLGDVPLR